MASTNLLSNWNIRHGSVLLGRLSMGVTTIVLLTAVSYSLHFGISSTGFVYLLAIILTAYKWGIWIATLTSLVAASCLNYFFVPPIFSFDVAERQDWIALGIFELTALLAAGLSAREERHMQEKMQQQQSIEKLYRVSHGILLMDLRLAPGPQVVRLIHGIFDMVAVVLFDASLSRMDSAGNPTELDEQLTRAAYLEGAAGKELGRETSQHALLLGANPIGGLVLRGPHTSVVADALASLASIALERHTLFERESRAEAGQQSEGLRTAVLDALAHAFKTPLTVIRTASSGLLEIGGLESRQQELALMIDEESIRLNELATRLLQTARLENNELSVKKENVVILAIIENAVQDRSSAFGDHQVDINFSDYILAVQGDPGLISIIISQFLDNAVKYSTPGTPISIGARKSSSEILISVHNEGPTISMEDRDRIFERFYRCADSKNYVAGTGIGLSIARKAADAHHGHVWVISAIDAGTTFYLSLPQL